MHLRNSFNQHNKVRRPGGSHRGAGRKKKTIGDGTTYGQLREAILGHEKASKSWTTESVLKALNPIADNSNANSGPVPMEVDRIVNEKGKGSKGKYSKGKSKGKSWWSKLRTLWTWPWRRPRGSVGRAMSFDIADRLPVVVRFPAGPQVSLKVGDQPKGRWRRPKKIYGRGRGRGKGRRNKGKGKGKQKGKSKGKSKSYGKNYGRKVDRKASRMLTRSNVDYVMSLDIGLESVRTG